MELLLILTTTEELAVPTMVNAVRMNIVLVAPNALATVLAAELVEFLSLVSAAQLTVAQLTTILSLQLARSEGTFQFLSQTHVIITVALRVLLRMVVCGLALLATTQRPLAPTMDVLILQTNVMVLAASSHILLPATITAALLVLLHMAVCGLELHATTLPLLALTMAAQTHQINALLLFAHIILPLLTTPLTIPLRQLTPLILLFLTLLLLRVVIITQLALVVSPTLPVCGILTRLHDANQKSNVILPIVP